MFPGVLWTEKCQEEPEEHMQASRKPDFVAPVILGLWSCATGSPLILLCNGLVAESSICPFLSIVVDEHSLQGTSSQQIPKEFVSKGWDLLNCM